MIRLVQTVILTRILGPAGIGQYSLVSSIVMLAAQVCTLGFPTSLLYYCQHDPANRRKYTMDGLWALCAWAIYAATSDALSSQYPRYLLFYAVVLVDRASAIAKETALTNAYWDQVMENEIKPIDAVVSVQTES